ATSIAGAICHAQTAMTTPRRSVANCHNAKECRTGRWPRSALMLVSRTSGVALDVDDTPARAGIAQVSAAALLGSAGFCIATVAGKSNRLIETAPMDEEENWSASPSENPNAE